MNPLKSTKEELLEQLANNHNACLPIDIKYRIDENVVTPRDLENIGIPEDIIPHISLYSEPDLVSKQNENPGRIKESCLEVYFWGVAASGKTCALAGILKTIQKDGYFSSADNCYNEYYLQSLKDNIIKDNGVAYFPEQYTNPNVIRYMNFNLIQEIQRETTSFWKKEKIYKTEIQTRKIAFIDLAGELIRNIVENDTRREKTNEDTIRTLKTLLNNAHNRKIHFFFIDYDRNNDALNQQSYLEKLIAIFRKEKYFDKTDFIYIVITKSDLFPCLPIQRREFAKSLFNKKYKTLITNLMFICCSGKGINMNKDGKVLLDNYILDFSMGDVYFKRLCKFNPDSAREIISILLSKVNPTDKLYG
jgi:hypothetical protein